MDLGNYEAIDWDPEDDPDGNLAHCMQPNHLGPNPERVVDEVTSWAPARIRLSVRTADFAIVGPDRSGAFWVLLLDVSWKRGDWLRPVTGWRALPHHLAVWRQQYPKG